MIISNNFKIGKYQYLIVFKYYDLKWENFHGFGATLWNYNFVIKFALDSRSELVYKKSKFNVE